MLRHYNAPLARN